MIDIPRGKYIGNRLGDQPKNEARAFHPMPSLRRGHLCHLKCAHDSNSFGITPVAGFRLADVARPGNNGKKIDACSRILVLGPGCAAVRN
jgi:hypothetical protein